MELPNGLTKLTNEKIYLVQISKILNFEKHEKNKKMIKASKPNREKFKSQQVNKQASQQVRRQKASKPASNRTFCTGLSSGNQVDGLPLGLHKDAVSASCVLPGRAPNHIFTQTNYASEIFYMEGRL